MGRNILKMAAILLCVFSLAGGGEKLQVHAKTVSDGSCLSGEVTVLKEKKKGHVMQINVANNADSGSGGTDFTGTVQVIFANPYSGYYTGSANCAYNTEITLSAQEKKQFTIIVPDFTVHKEDGLCALKFIDEEGNVLRTISMEKVFDHYKKDIQVGILSDNYAGLNYMSMRGLLLSIYNSKNCSGRLTKLDNKNLKEQLDELYFLIIDRFNVSLLSDEDIQAVQDWVKEGGRLLIGTGEYAEQTLSGFDKDFIDVNVSGISRPGEENILSANAETRYYRYRKNEIDFINMAVADLNYNNNNSYFYESRDNPAICSSLGDGAVMIFFCSLEDKELQKLDTDAIHDIYNEAIEGSDDYCFEKYSDISEQLFAFMDRVNTGDIMADNVDADNADTGNAITGNINTEDIKEDDIDEDAVSKWFEVMAFLIVMDVLILYFNLCGCKNRKSYWICAAVLAIVTLSIPGILFIGKHARIKENARVKENTRVSEAVQAGEAVQVNEDIQVNEDAEEKENAQVNENRVYSVITQRVDGNRVDAYFLAYRSDASPWEIRLKDNYEMANPGSSSGRFIDGTYGPNTDDYFYTINNDSKGVSVGIKPGKFQDGFFYAEGGTESKGTIFCENSGSSEEILEEDMDRTITNGTDFDMAYMAIWLENYIMIFSDVKAGETICLRQAVQDGRCVYESNTSSYRDMYSRMIPIYNPPSDMEYGYELDDMAALLAGLGIAKSKKPVKSDRAIIAGLITEYDKVINDECNEISYGCFYTYAQ